MQRLNQVLEQLSWTLLVFQQRYGGGWSAIVGPWGSHLSWIQDNLDGGDFPAVHIQEYFCNQGSWLPMVTAGDPAEAVTALDEKLKKVPDSQLERGSEWAEAVESGISSLLDAERKHKDDDYCIALAMDAGELPVKPEFMANWPE